VEHGRGGGNLHIDTCVSWPGLIGAYEHARWAFDMRKFLIRARLKVHSNSVRFSANMEI